MCIRDRLHATLEQKLAEFKHAEACLTFQSGFTANLATIAALVAVSYTHLDVYKRQSLS